MSEPIPDALAIYMRGLAQHDIALIGSTFADDIRFVTPTKTMVRHEILEFLSALYRGFPNWSYDHDPPLFCDDGSIAVRWRQGGTHTAPLAFTGFDTVSATGKTVTIPEHDFTTVSARTNSPKSAPTPSPAAPRVASSNKSASNYPRSNNLLTFPFFMYLTPTRNIHACSLSPEYAR